MTWWEECAAELPAYIARLEDEIEQLESQLAQLKAVPEGRKSEIVMEFFARCRNILTGEELVFVALKFSGFTCDGICGIVESLSSSKSAIHRKIQAANLKLQQQFPKGISEK